MTLDAVRWIARAHGAVAWLATAVLVAAAASSLGRGASRPRRRLLAVAALLLTAAFVAGLVLDLPYRGVLRQQVFLDSSVLGWLFERKLHLAFGALALVWCALALDRAASPARDGVMPGADLLLTARLALSAGAVLAVLAALFSALATSRHQF